MSSLEVVAPGAKAERDGERDGFVVAREGQQTAPPPQADDEGILPIILEEYLDKMGMM